MNMLEKKCSDCEIIKDIKEFSISIYSQNKCRVCVKREYDREYSRKYYEENKDRILEKRKKYREDNRDKIKENKKKYREENKDRLREYDRKYRKKYREENRDIINEWNREYQKNRTLEDPLYKLKKRMRTLINNSLRNGGYIKGSKTNNILGCSYEELLDHLNNNKYGFVYGDENLDIDHIIPLSKATTKDEIIKLNHYTNLQLLPSDYNRFVKRDKDFDRDCLEEWLEKNK